MQWCVVCLVALTAAGTETVEADKEKPLEKVARFAIGQVVSFVLDSPTTVERVRLNSEEQLLELNNLKIANPKGFDGDTAIFVENVRVQADPKLLFSDEPVVRVVGVTGASVNSEANLGRGFNLKKLLDNAMRFGEPKLLKRLPKKKWRIEKAVVETCEVNMITKLLEKQTTTKRLERFEMDFLGEDGKGMTADQAIVKVLKTLMEKADVPGAKEILPGVSLLDVLRNR